MDLKSHTVPYRRKDGGSLEFEDVFIPSLAISSVTSTM